MGAMEVSQGSCMADEGGLFQRGFAKHTCCATRRTDGPGAHSATAGAALAQ